MPSGLGGVVGDSVGILEDYAALATGLLTLHQVTGDDSWLTAAHGLLDTALTHFADPDRGGRWFDTADDAEALLVRPADPVNGATPSGASLVAEALLTKLEKIRRDKSPFAEKLTSDEARGVRFVDGSWRAFERHDDLVPMHPYCHGLLHRLIDRDRVLSHHRGRRVASAMALGILQRRMRELRETS